MSRSKKKQPYIAVTTATSEKEDKTLANRKIRKRNKDILSKAEDDTQVLDRKAITDTWSFSKDGRMEKKNRAFSYSYNLDSLVDHISFTEVLKDLTSITFTREYYEHFRELKQRWRSAVALLTVARQAGWILPTTCSASRLTLHVSLLQDQYSFFIFQVELRL